MQTIPVQPAYVTNGYGQPQVMLQPMSYEQQMMYNRQMVGQQKEYIERRLKESFPKAYAIIHSIILILIGLAQSALQIVLIINKGAIYYVGNGIWGGCFCIFLAIMNLALCNKLIKRIFSFRTLFG